MRRCSICTVMTEEICGPYGRLTGLQRCIHCDTNCASTDCSLCRLGKGYIGVGPGR